MTMTPALMDAAAVADYKNDLKAFNDKELEAERNQVQENVDREVSWLEAICAEQRIRKSAATVSRYFTFGQTHMTNFPLPRGGRLADYYVKVTLRKDWDETHRHVFMREFTSQFCPEPIQFAFEYDEGTLKMDCFPKGQLCEITDSEIVK